MKFGLLEILGIFVLVVGLCTGIGAAALVSVGLAVAVTALVLIFGGVVIVYVAATLERESKATARSGERS